MRLLRHDGDDHCGIDHKPQMGTACDGGPSEAWSKINIRTGQTQIYSPMPETCTLRSKYMTQIPKGGLVKGPYKPICRDCAIYFSTTV